MNRFDIIKFLNKYYKLDSFNNNYEQFNSDLHLSLIEIYSLPEIYEYLSPHLGDKYNKMITLCKFKDKKLYLKSKQLLLSNNKNLFNISVGIQFKSGGILIAINKLKRCNLLNYLIEINYDDIEILQLLIDYKYDINNIYVKDQYCTISTDIYRDNENINKTSLTCVLEHNNTNNALLLLDNGATISNYFVNKDKLTNDLIVCMKQGNLEVFDYINNKNLITSILIQPYTNELHKYNNIVHYIEKSSVIFKCVKDAFYVKQNQINEYNPEILKLIIDKKRLDNKLINELVYLTYHNEKDYISFIKSPYQFFLDDNNMGILLNGNYNYYSDHIYDIYKCKCLCLHSTLNISKILHNKDKEYDNIYTSLYIGFIYKRSGLSVKDLYIKRLFKFNRQKTRHKDIDYIEYFDNAGYIQIIDYYKYIFRVYQIFKHSYIGNDMAKTIIQYI